MPELPEVDTICWRLREGGHGEPPLVGRTLVSVDVDDDAVLRSGDVAAARGGQVVDVTRRAKWITIHVAPTPTTKRTTAKTASSATAQSTRQSTRQTTIRLLVHLVMTGDLHVVPAVPARFVRWRARLDDDAWLVFTDPRRFGHLDVTDDDAPFFAGLGVEPLSDDFAPALLAGARRGRRAVKTALLDQSLVVGLGNIWADESLHVAGLDPRRSLADLDDHELVRLHGAIKATLQQAIAEAQTELVWRYGNTAAPSPFRVYDRGGEPCRGCATTLSSTKLAGRTTVWCPRCQPAR